MAVMSFCMPSQRKFRIRDSFICTFEKADIYENFKNKNIFYGIYLKLGTFSDFFLILFNYLFDYNNM